MISQPPIVLLDLHVNPNEASVSTIQETRHMNDYNSHVVCVRSDPSRSASYRIFHLSAALLMTKTTACEMGTFDYVCHSWHVRLVV
jgi:hypothetical protein